MEQKKIDTNKHIFVPKHVKLKEEEKLEFLKANNLSKTQLPKISKKDPAIQEMSPEKGDIIKIIRKSPTTGEATFYRIVV